MPLSNKLRLYRRDMHLSQEQVANALGVDRSTYAYYETGKNRPNISMLTQISLLYGVSMAKLIEDEIIMTEPAAVLHDNVPAYQSDALPMSRLSREEQDFILIFRQLSEEGQKDLEKRAQTLLEKKMELE